jgi:hypothetical protein
VTVSPADGELRARMGARDALLARLREQPAFDIGRWSRDELYDDDDRSGAAPSGGTGA